METTMSSEIVERAQPIELGEVEIEDCGAVSGLGELLKEIQRLRPGEYGAKACGDDEVELAMEVATGWLPFIAEFCELPEGKYRITAWPLVRVEVSSRAISVCRHSGRELVGGAATAECAGPTAQTGVHADKIWVDGVEVGTVAP